MVKISIVVAVYNRKLQIKETLKSVINQDYDHIEIVIVDGLSSDGTIEEIKSLVLPNMILISEEDKGIYDAMNKGIQYANGDYILFMNVGDCFANDQVVTSVVSNIQDEDDCVYGGVISKFPEGKVSYPASDINSIWKGKPFSHQSVFTKATWLKTKPFDLSHPICADYDHVYWMFKNQAVFKRLDFIVSIVDRNEGSTNGDFRKVFWDNSTVMIKYGQKPLLLLFIYFRFYKELLIKEVLPTKVVQYARKIKLRLR